MAARLPRQVTADFKGPNFSQRFRRQRQLVAREARAHPAGYALVAGTSVYFQSPLAVTLWLAPMLATRILHPVQNITEHTGAGHAPDALRNTRTITTWPVLRWMCWNMQYHSAHHTYPAVPFFRLPELHAKIVARLGHEPPHTGYLAFQRRYITSLMRRGRLIGT